LVARRFGRHGDGIRAAVIVATAALGARALKAGLEASDPLRAEAARELGSGFYPSGHAAVAMALCLGTMLVARTCPRWLVLAGGAWCAVHGLVIVATRSHHVSDVFGGYLLGVTVASTIGLRGRRGDAIAPRIEWSATRAFVAATIAASLLMELARRAAPVGQPRMVLLVSTVALSLAALLLVIGFVRLLHAPARR